MKVPAENAVFGEWYDWDTERVRFVGEINNRNRWRVFLESEGGTTNLDGEILTHLPDCDGWDWQPPKPEKKYRAFQTMQEWWPHRERWIRWDTDVIKLCWRGTGIVSNLFDSGCVFLNDDGTDAEPFGVEATQ
jgi:hypothetical protein